jgi:hypothetical protein
MTNTLSNYHWIKCREFSNDGFIPLLFNKGLYRLDTEGGSVFLTPYKLKLLYGTNCIHRPVEAKDILEYTDDDILDMRLSNALIRFDDKDILITACYLYPLRSMVLNGCFTVIKEPAVQRLRYKED